MVTLLNALLTAMAMLAVVIPAIPQTMVTMTIPKPESISDIFAGTGCQPKDDTLADTLLVRRNGRIQRMSLDKAFAINTNNDKTDNVSVLGICKGEQ